MKKYSKNKNFDSFLSKILYILLKIIKITPGTKVPKIAQFCKKWDFFALFITPNTTVLT